jgi:hypothetical protein
LVVPTKLDLRASMCRRTTKIAPAEADAAVSAVNTRACPMERRSVCRRSHLRLIGTRQVVAAILFAALVGILMEPCRAEKVTEDDAQGPVLKGPPLRRSASVQSRPAASASPNAVATKPGAGSQTESASAATASAETRRDAGVLRREKQPIHAAPRAVGPPQAIDSAEPPAVDSAKPQADGPVLGGAARTPRRSPLLRATPAAAIESLAPLPDPPEQFWTHERRRHEEEPEYAEKPIGALTTNILPSRGDLPANYAAARFDKAGQEFHTVGTSRPWMDLVYDWEATAFCHGPLYFEQPNAERLGHTAGPIFQPFVSGAHFFAHIPALPYMIAADPPGITCTYTLGHYRPGSYAPLRYIRLPLSISGAAVQAGVVVGLVYLIP